MNILIMGQSEAAEYLPINSTYAIRILYSFQQSDPGLRFKPLQSSSLYRVVHEYLFDDTFPEMAKSKEVLFNLDLAEKMLRDFVAGRAGCEDLLVHCSLGRNRSPAVAIAFNEIFSLGENGFALSRLYNRSNWFVYNTLIEKAKRLGIK